jgi:hypothetical protein
MLSLTGKDKLLPMLLLAFSTILCRLLDTFNPLLALPPRDLSFGLVRQVRLFASITVQYTNSFVKDGQPVEATTRTQSQALLTPNSSGKMPSVVFSTGVSMFSALRHLMSHGSL